MISAKRAEVAAGRHTSEIGSDDEREVALVDSFCRRGGDEDVQIERQRSCLSVRLPGFELRDQRFVQIDDALAIAQGDAGESHEGASAASGFLGSGATSA